jgi:transcriptional regulator with GAF, ATPase, and Fis domain
MGERFTLLHDARLHAVQPLVTSRLRELATVVGTGAFDEFFDGTMRALLTKCLAGIGADEGTVWLLDQERTYLLPRWNNGPFAANFVGHYRQSLRVGMISMVVATEQPICENDVQQNERQDKTLDRTLGVRTCAMIATPLYFAGDLRGVLSAVRLQPAESAEPAPPGFEPGHIESLQLIVAVLARMLEHQLLGLALGLEDLA